MTTSIAKIPAGLPLIVPFIAGIRKRAAAHRRAFATVSAPAAAAASVWSLYRMSSADSVSPKVAAILAARAAD